jgi:hypothetical protein
MTIVHGLRRRHRHRPVARTAAHAQPAPEPKERPVRDQLLLLYGGILVIAVTMMTLAFVIAWLVTGSAV